jgi:hypothetical protein
MRLVLRRLRGARTLLLAAVVATLIAVSFVVGLLVYGRDVVIAAAQTTIASAPPEERSVLVRGAADVGGTGLAEKDRALREAVRDGIGGRQVEVSLAGYSVGRQLTGPVGTAAGDTDGIVYGDVVFLENLEQHTTLVSGDWAQPGAATTEVTLARAAAAVLEANVGSRIPILDRRTGVTTEVVLAGIWEPTDLSDPYWRLAPGVSNGVVAGGNSYGPIALDRADFMRSWAADASVGWIVAPDLAGVGLDQLIQLRSGIGPLGSLPDEVGLAGTGQLSTRMYGLVDRLTRADLVGRSALLTPVLLIVVLGVYALLLIAMLLTEHRRAETALIRARGAARAQIAGLAAREATLLILPAILVGPPLANAVLTSAGRLPVFADASIRLAPTLSPWLWAIAVAAALICLVAMVGPSVRRSGTYVEELASRSRPSRLAFAQRASVDVALVGLAVLAWFQLRQYASPLSGGGGGLGIDPLLVVAPTVGVLAGAVVSLRLLPFVTRFAERHVDRKHWPATMFGMWQAGRRPHAGPVLLLSLAVAVSTLAWAMLSTAEQSLVDQAEFGVGADLRLVEANGFAPDGRTAQLATLAGVAAVAPVSRDTLTLGPEDTPTAVVGIDADLASTVVRYRDDLGGGPGMFASLAAARPALPGLPLPPGSTRFASDVSVRSSRSSGVALTTTATVLTGRGQLIRVAIGTVRTNEPPQRFNVALPADAELSVVRFDVGVGSNEAELDLRWSLTHVQVADPTGNWSEVDLAAGGGWQLTDARNPDLGQATRPLDDPRGIAAGRTTGTLGRGTPRAADFGVIPVRQPGAVPAAVTAGVLHALRIEVGDTVDLTVAGADVTLRVVAEVVAVPGTSHSRAAMIADLPSLAVALGRVRPVGLTVAENWVAAVPGSAATVAEQTRLLPGVRTLDQATLADTAGREPYGVGGRSALFAAGLGALLLALIGIAVDVRAATRRRVGEFAVLQTMGAGSRLLARAVLAEQAFLAGLGVLVGLIVGVGVAATMAPLVILTPTADRPEPVPLLQLPWLPVLATAGALFGAAMLLSGIVAATLGRRLAVARLRIGDDL